MKVCLLAVLSVAAPMLEAAGQAPDVSAILKAVEARYNRPKTMQMAFEQSLSGTARISQREKGTLYLAKPGKMRWQYSQPAGKTFLVDGKTVWFYTPNTNRVERSPVKQSDDMRAPLAFLLGQLDFQKYFSEFRSKPEGDSVRISAAPKSKKAPYTNVEFVVTPAYDIKSLKVLGQDGSVMEFGFSAVTPDPKLDPKLFQFQAPAGAEVVEVEEQ